MLSLCRLFKKCRRDDKFNNRWNILQLWISYVIDNIIRMHSRQQVGFGPINVVNANVIHLICWPKKKQLATLEYEISVGLFLNSGGHLDQKNKSGRTALEYLKVVRLLMQRDFQFAIDDWGYSSSFTAIYYIIQQNSSTMNLNKCGELKYPGNCSSNKVNWKNSKVKQRLRGFKKIVI